MRIGSLILVWYRDKWHIAQYCCLSDEPHGYATQIVRFLTSTDSPIAKYNTPYRETCKDSQMRIIEEDDCIDASYSSLAYSSNIEALKAALDRNILYRPTGLELDEWWEDADMIQKEAREISISPEVAALTREERDLFNKRQKIGEARQNPMMLVQPSMSLACGAQILSVVAHSKQKVPVHLKVENMVRYECEWAYVVDLDHSFFETYSGFRLFNPIDVTKEEKQRFDDESFVRRERRQPILLKRYEFHALDSISREQMIMEIDVARRDCRGFL